VAAPEILSDVERAAGATLRSYDGVELPERFHDPVDEACAVRREAGLFDLGFRVRLRFSGPDRADFLHNLLSNDVRSLRPGGGCYATILTRESRVIADTNVVCAEEDILLDVDVRLRDRARSHLEQYLIADDVEIEDRTAAEATLGVHGPRSEEMLRSAVGGDELPSSELGHRPAAIAGIPVRVVRVHWTGEPGFDVWVPLGDAAKVWRTLEAGGARAAGTTAFEALRMEAGLPLVGIDVDESHLVLEAGLERGVHFRKGCYLGQEVVERQSARGHVNRKLVGIRLEGAAVPPSGAKVVTDGKEIGHVTRAILSPTLGRPIAFAWVRREAMVPGTKLVIEGGPDGIEAEVVKLPFHRGSR